MDMMEKWTIKCTKKRMIKHMRKQGKKNLGKKGFIFTLDLIVGMSILFTVVMITLFFVARGSEVTLAEHQFLRLGSDIVAVMDEQKMFDSLDHEAIERKMEELLPGQYEMLIRLQGNFTAGNGTIEVGGEIPAERLLISGRRAALTDDDTYLKVTYFMWGRRQ